MTRSSKTFQFDCASISTFRPSSSKKPFSLAITRGAQSVNLIKPNFKSVFSKSKTFAVAAAVWLAETSETIDHVKHLISTEFQRSRSALQTIIGTDELLDGTPWLKESIRMRNRYIDPLNLIQVDLLRRSSDCPATDEEQVEELRHLTRLTINGIAAGMRTSG